MALDQVPAATDLTALLALNNAHATELSWLEPARLEAMLANAFMARGMGEAEALLIAFDQDAAYDGANFKWFRRLYPRFIYVDRIVTAPEARGRGHARRLYAELFEKARAAGHGRIVCEVNVEPPNPRSMAFHASLGFREVGRAAIDDGVKTVAYLACPLTDAT